MWEVIGSDLENAHVFRRGHVEDFVNPSVEDWKIVFVFGVMMMNFIQNISKFDKLTRVSNPLKIGCTQKHQKINYEPYTNYILLQ